VGGGVREEEEEWKKLSFFDKLSKSCFEGNTKYFLIINAGFHNYSTFFFVETFCLIAKGP
jgi:hypothetical protein